MINGTHHKVEKCHFLAISHLPLQISNMTFFVYNKLKGAYTVWKCGKIPSLWSENDQKDTATFFIISTIVKYHCVTNLSPLIHFRLQPEYFVQLKGYFDTLQIWNQRFILQNFTNVCKIWSNGHIFFLMNSHVPFWSKQFYGQKWIWKLISSIIGALHLYLPLA